MTKLIRNIFNKGINFFSYILINSYYENQLNYIDKFILNKLTI